MTKADVCDTIVEGGVIPVIRAATAEEGRRCVEALIAGGITAVEVTMTVPGAVGLISDVCAAHGSLLVGAGTVLNPEEAASCVEAGARFIVSPATNVNTIQFCRNNDVAIMPGALTPTEIVAAWNAGADFVKVFPAGALGGPSYLRSIKAPLPNIKLIPTGGVSLSNAADFIRSGAEAVGVGADLVDLHAIREGRAASITEHAQKYIQIVRDARQG